MFEILANSVKRRQSQANPEQKIIAISSPHGSTGKTTIAINLAFELAAQKFKVLLIDADFSGSSIPNHLLITELPAGFRAAFRIAAQNRFDLEQLERLSIQYPKSNLTIMPAGGVALETEISLLTLESILGIIKSTFDYCVIDLPAVENGSVTTPAEMLTKTLVGLADEVLIAVSADPIGIFRLLESEEAFLSNSTSARLIINRLRNSVIPQAKKEITVTLERLSQIPIGAFFPEDAAAVDQALRTGIPVQLLARSGAFRTAMHGFVRTGILGLQGKLDSRLTKLG